MKIKRLRYNRRKVFLGLFLFLSLLGITVGYSLITTKLTIDGVATVKDAKWDVHFTNFQAMSGSVAPVTNPTITNTDVTFSAKLDEPGDFYGFTIDVTNQGTINADIGSFTLTPDFSNIAYLDATIVYNDDTPVQTGDVLPANKTKRIKVKLEYKDGIDESLYPSVNQIHSVTLSMNYEQYTGVIASVWELPQGKTKDTLSIGDEICLKDDPTQCFNFIKYDNDDVIMLAKYNLKVGDIYDATNWIKTGEYTSSDPGYNKQSSEVIGFKNGLSISNGLVAFSATNYWYDGSALKPEYGSSYPTDVYDATNYKTEPDFSVTCDSTHCWHTPGYSIAYYVEGYKDILEGEYEASIKEARLLTNSEALDSSIGCSDSSCPTTGDSAFIVNTSFWLGTARNYRNAGVITANASLFYYYNDYGDYFGVRPVIVITKSDL